MVGKKGKILLIILIFMMVFEMFSPIVFADDIIPDELVADESIDEDGTSGGVLGSIMDFGAGILFYPIKIFTYFFGKAIHTITEAAAGSGQKVTPETILFNQLDLTNINFFDNKQSSLPFVNALRDNVAGWFVAMRTLAIIASVCILLYIAIRMAMSTIASEKAEYKRMFTDWAVGFALIFVLQYIIILVIDGNNLIVQTLQETISSTASSGETQIKDYLGELESMIWGKVDFSLSLGAIMVYVILVGITLAFLLMYIKRMIVVAFLIIISPLITITYAIDKVGDSKSQALNAWFKEFVWTILVQPFHCVIYVVFVSISLDSLTDKTLSSSVLAIMCMVFILQAEDIVKKIFGIQADNIGKMSNAMAMAGGAALIGAKFSKSSGGAAAGAIKKNAASSTSNSLKTKDGMGLGTGPTTDSKNNPGGQTFSQKVANVLDNPRVQNKMKAFNNALEDKKWGRALNSTGKVLGNYTKFSYDAGARMFGAGTSMAGANGINDVVAGYMAGAATGNVLKRTVTGAARKSTVDVIEKGRTRNAQANLTESYKQLKNTTNFSDSQIEKKAKVLIKMDLNSEVAKSLSDAERLFAHNLQTMKARLEKSGEDTSFDNVYSKIKLKNDQK